MISVIVPIYNVEKYAARCLDSILRQTYTEYEIICVDDCGTDGSMRIVQQYADRFPEKIRIVGSDRNAGLGGARDKGIRAAAGEYLAFIDSDDAITEDYLECYVKAAAETRADIVAGGSCRITDSGKTSLPGNPDDAWYCWVNVSAWAKLFRAEFIKKNGIDFRGIRTYEDAPFIYRCLAKKPVVTVIPHDGYWYYQNPGSITTSGKNDRTRLYEAYADDLTAMYRETAFAEEDQEILCYCMASQLITNLLFNGQHAGRKRMAELYGKCSRFLNELDPGLRRNRFVRSGLLVSEPELNGRATRIILQLRKWKLDTPVFYMVSVMPKIR